MCFGQLCVKQQLQTIQCDAFTNELARTYLISIDPDMGVQLSGLTILTALDTNRRGYIDHYYRWKHIIDDKFVL
jgi:hypothetical protein